ncbi:ATP-dependent DNA helicase [Rozella allomycis CSF55]|uniref:ATP-dependent DNA helicase n=1 Tax=Rozella allomycis (strain CSF55) TaxID=988480 RepID=A0A075AVN4_ROZAC|nr:DNA helicase, ATP-dependent, RecQ type domain-containing protein [Rozella allomycis CSF55]RKP21284.1 ATP-dependent DNA helicase [Rozella allomycis CSF55]|eukprot:EPZ34388.1 DNA helicase, ATP-dependent, RecQ type domain-containing protein [Rozella allomycis CSF55]
MFKFKKSLLSRDSQESQSDKDNNKEVPPIKSNIADKGNIKLFNESEKTYTNALLQKKDPPVKPSYKSRPEIHPITKTIYASQKNSGSHFVSAKDLPKANIDVNSQQLYPNLNTQQLYREHAKSTQASSSKKHHDNGRKNADHDAQYISSLSNEDWSKTDFPWSRTVKKALRLIFKMNDFRNNQAEIINAILSNRDVFVLMPTGGGKSLCYQLPAIVSGGITFVVSPLLSLIYDQVQGLIKRDIPAIPISGEMTEKEKNSIFVELSKTEPVCKIYYVTPELLVQSKHFQSILERLYQQCLIARLAGIRINKAHCLSQWGHDFRPDYKELSILKRKFPEVPILALTATATHQTTVDIKACLNIKKCERFAQSFNRSNLSYRVEKKTKDVLKEISCMIKAQFPCDSGIIYCTSKSDCEVMAEKLNNEHQIKTSFYHAGLSKTDRQKVQSLWAKGSIQVIVATIAFGMGIDKADVRFVIHHSIPKSLEGYYQETGRAGRDGNPSKCILFYTFKDKSKIDFMIDRSDGTRDQKERQRENLRHVINYCENKIDCRRKIVLSHFGENFNPADCRKTCDNCERNFKYSAIDYTKEAKEIISLVSALENITNPTMTMAVSLYRGSKAKSVAEFVNRVPCFAKGSNLNINTVTRIFKELILQNILTEYYRTNNGGFTNTYLKTGRMAHSLINGKATLKINEVSTNEKENLTLAYSYTEDVFFRWNEDNSLVSHFQFTQIIDWPSSRWNHDNWGQPITPLSPSGVELWVWSNQT